MEKPGVMKMPNVECCRRNARSLFLILLCGAGFLCDAMDFKGEGKNVVMKSDAILFNGSGKAKALSPRRVHAQYRMVFEYKADTEGTLKITLYFKNGSSGSHALKLMPDRIFRRTVLALDGDFKLHDSFFDLNQTVLSWKSNRNGNVMIRKIRIVPESELARRLRNFGSRFSLEGEAGRRLYCVRAENPGGGNPVTVGAAYLAPDVVLATERKYVAPFFAALTVPAERRGSRIAGPAGEPLAWCSIDLKSILSRGRKKTPGDLGGALFKGVNLIYAEWNTIGDGEFWRLDAIARCDDGKSAQRFAFAVPTWLQLGGSLLFSDDPVLGREFLKRVRVMPDGDRVILELEIPRPMAERLIRYFGEQAKKRIIPPDPVPQDIRRPRLEGVRD